MHQATVAELEERFGSNAIRLTGRQWAVVAALLAALFTGIPAAWQRVEAFQPGPDYRTPYSLSNDYWQYDRYAHVAARENKVLVLGDSVVWGEYVAPDATLPHELNALAGKDAFLNLGVNGIHPVALAGLIAFYGGAISDRAVLLHYNPLWMSSDQHDLRTDKEFRFNHPKLVPQFSTSIPCYKDPWAERLGIVAERYFPFRGWSNHLTIAYFDNTDLATWDRENPYANPLRQITLELPQPDPGERHANKPWFENGMTETGFPWVEPAESLQWRFFREAVDTLRARGNRVFVLVGPFNEHMMTPESRQTYAGVKQAIAAWLEERNLPHYVAPVLPSELYGDASHPLAEGYAVLASELFGQEGFRQFADVSTEAQPSGFETPA